MTDAWRRSPNEVDPLSWFSGPLVPIVFGGMAMTYGVTVTLLSQWRGDVPWFDWAAVACLLLGFISIGIVSRPMRTASPFILLAPPVLLGWASLILSLVGHIEGARLMVELWWAPVGLSFLIAALAPYASTIRLTAVGLASAIVTGAAIVVVPYHRNGYWPPFSEALIGSGPILVATAAAGVFAFQVSSRIHNWSATDPGSALTSGVLGEAAKLRTLREELASVSERTVPFLQRIADSGLVTAADREHARLLGDEVRTELVATSNRSWLDTIATDMNLTVVDAEHQADRMTANQRAALLGLLRAATEGASEGAGGGASKGAGGGRSAIVIQLRREPDGSTAVALSTDVQLPEGRRITLLAPHYFSLKATVDSLEWETGDRLGLRFRLPPEQ